MNRHLYRTVFNRSTGTRTAVAETAGRQGKATSPAGAISRGAASQFPALRLAPSAVGIAMLFGGLAAADAQVVAYRNAPGNQRPTVLQTGNGVPLVNIQTPSAQGVSRNVYQQFDVDAKGVILNNARGHARTELGGYVQGNPWLATGAAKVILNEVNSSNPSYLRGYVEVAGDRAHVVIANPAGLYVGNAGFINASRATLTTGMPSVAGGNLDRYRVAGGTVVIDGAGLDAKSADYTDIMARAVQVNADIWSRNLKVSTGLNTISADHGVVAPTAGASGTAPGSYSIDVAQFSGMYSGKIFLVGTEHGVGMRNAGAIAADAGDVVVTVDGRLENMGRIAAAHHIAATAGGLDNRGGQLQAGGNASLMLGAGQLDNSGGLIRAGMATAIAASRVVNTDTQARDNNGNNTQGIEGQSLTLAADAVDNRAGAIRANANLTLTGSGAIDNSAGLLSAGQTLDVHDVHSAGVPKTQAIANAGGTLIAGKRVTVDSAALSGDGKVFSLGDLSMQLDADYINTGITQADGNATVTTAGKLLNGGKLLAGKTLAATAAAIDNQAGGQIIASRVQLQATDSHTFTNRGLIDGSDTFIDSPTIENLGTGRIYGDHVALSGSTLDNRPETVGGIISAPVIAARQRMDLGVATINNSDHALIYSAGDLVTGNALDASHQATGTGDAINNASATIAADGNATINHQVVNNINAHLETTIDYSTGRRIVQFRLNGATDKLDGDTVRLVDKGSGRTLAAQDWASMGDEDNFRLVLPSTSYPFERYGAARYRTAYTAAYSMGGGNDNPQIDFPEAFNYQPDDPVWQIMGVPPPAQPLAGGPPRNPGGQVCSGDSCYYDPGTPEQQAAWKNAYAAWQAVHDRQVASYQALNSKIDAFNSDWDRRTVAEWTIYDGTEQIARTRVTRSDPAMIKVGGNLRFNSLAVNNANSQIVAGGDATGNNILGTQPTNTGVPGIQTVTTTGQAQYTYIKRHSTRSDDRRYDGRPYEGQSVQTRFVLDITPTNGSGPQQDQALKSTPSAVPGNATMVVRTSNPDIALPDSALFVPGNGRYLVATDPQFANYRAWLGSDYMLTQLSQDPNLVMKRLGDGYYEQQLVQRQIQKAIGQRYLGNGSGAYASNEAQYQALMNAGVQMAQTFHYQLGVALTAQQMALLTSDIVWLVRQTVTLADGSTQEVLAPQVYLRANRLQVTGEGTLIAAANVQFQTAQDILNSGTIAAKNTVTLAANNINNLGGRISGADTLLQAQTDINNLGGAIDAVNGVTVTAGRDINVNSTSVATANATTTGTNIDSMASITATNLALSAGRDLTANAAILDATGNASLAAGRDVNLGTVKQGYTEQIRWADDQGASNWVGKLTGPNFADQANGAHGVRETGVNRATVSASQETATQLTGNNIIIQAGRDLSTQGTQAVANAALSATAGRDINAGTANESASARDEHQKSSSGILSGSTTQTDDASSYSRQIGSTFSGNTTVLTAGNDINITGSDVVSTQGTQITAVNDINIVAATDTGSESHYRKETTSGIFSGSGLGVTVGSKMQSTDVTRNTTTASASTVGATTGNVTLAAGNRYSQVASNVVAPQGDVSIAARQVDIVAGVNTEQNVQETLFKQQGVTVQVTNPIVSAIQTAMAMQEAKGKTKNGRAKMLADAATALTLANTAAQLSAAAPTGGIDVAFSIGASSNQSKTVQSSTTSAASTVAAKGTTSIAATGAGQASNLNVIGSEISGENVSLVADNQINLAASRNTNEEHSTNKGSSASVGVSIGSSGVMFNASASGSRGKGDGSDTSYDNTAISAVNQLNMSSGGDTNIKGGTASGKQVTATVGGNLNIESLQETSNYKSQQQSLGGSVSAGAGKGFSASISASRSKVDGNYQSVIEQSGINAGDGGFNVTVAGNTDLKGAKIASTDQAVADNKNRFTTGTLTTSDIQNKSEYKAESQSISAGGGYKGGNTALNGFGAGWANESGSDSSVTKSGISGIAGDATVRSDKDSSNALAKNWNAQELQQDVEAQAKITQEVFKQVVLATVDRGITSATAAKKILKQICESGGQNCQNIKVEQADVAIVDGKIYVYNHGIMNSEKQALENAAKQSSDAANAQGVYVIINPHTGNPVAEVLYAGWDKLNEILGGVLPISNASKANIDIREQAKAQGGVVIEVDHSRGSLTSSNALAEQLNQGHKDVALGSVTFNGAAANAERMADRVNQATGGQGAVYQSTHKDDPVGTMIGGNKPTGGNDTKFPDSHGAYTGYLPPEFDKNGKPYDLRDTTDSAWGRGKIGTPVLVLPSNKVEDKK